MAGRGGAGSGGSIQAGGASGAAGQAGSSGGANAGNGGQAGSSGGSGAGSGGSAPLEAITLWIAGDSTVATKGGTPCPIGWGGQFDAEFNDLVSVVNSAVGGRSVRTWLYDVGTTKVDGECVLGLDDNGEPTLQQRWQDMLAGMKSGDYLFIQFGINDGTEACPRHVGLAAFKSEYGMMAQAAKERGAHPIFVTPVSAIDCNGSTPKGTRGSFVTTTQEAGEEFDVPVIDLHAASIALYTTLGFCPLPGGVVNASTTGPVGDFFCDDHTHFAEPGAVQIAQLVAQALVDQNIGLAAYLE